MLKVFTIGHSYISADEFTSLLQQHDIQALVDVRSFPGSRRSPQFGAEQMQNWLTGAGINYGNLKSIGGRRRVLADRDERNAGWENESFRNYADYTRTPDWVLGMQTLQRMASEYRVAIMCGEPMPWRCHRSIISDNLVALGWDVEHIYPNGSLHGHKPGAWGATPKIEGHQVTYPITAVI